MERYNFWLFYGVCKKNDMRCGLWCDIPEKPHAACVWIMLSLFVVYVAERTCELVEVGEIFWHVLK